MPNKKISAAGPTLEELTAGHLLETESATGASGHFSLATLVDFLKTIMGFGLANGVATLDINGSLVLSQVPQSTKARWFHGFYLGLPPNSTAIYSFIPGVATNFQQNFPGSRAVVRTAPAAATNFPIQVNGVTKGSINFSANSTQGTFTSVGALGLLAGDIVTILTPTPVDPALRDIHFALQGTLA